MVDEKVVVCRLCLSVITLSDSEVLDNISRSILRDLIPELNLDITHNSKICRSCNKAMLVSYEFKNSCNEKLIHTEIKIEDQSEVGKTAAKDVSSQCDFCLVIFDNKIAGPSELRMSSLTEALDKCLPEWSLLKGEASTPCQKCLQTLRNQFNFVNVCLGTERKIKTYCESQGTNSEGKINLYEALHFILGSETQYATVKKEEDDSYDFTVKTEDLDIKSEDSEEDPLDNSSSPGPEMEMPILTQTTSIASVTVGHSDQSQQGAVSYFVVGSNILLPSRPVQTLVLASEQAERKAQAPTDAPAPKRRRVKARQASPPLMVPKKEKPEQRSVGVQVDVRDLIAHYSVGIQVDTSDLTSRSVAVDAKPDVSDKQVACRPRVLHATTSTGGAITMGKKVAKKRTRKSKK